MVLISPFIVFPPLPLWSSLSELCEMLPPGCSPHCAPNKSYSQLSSGTYFFSWHLENLGMLLSPRCGWTNPLQGLNNSKTHPLSYLCSHSAFTLSWHVVRTVFRQAISKVRDMLCSLVSEAWTRRFPFKFPNNKEKERERENDHIFGNKKYF